MADVVITRSSTIETLQQQPSNDCNLKATTTPNLDCDHAIIVEMVPAAEDIELQKLECSGRNEGVSTASAFTVHKIAETNIVFMEDQLKPSTEQHIVVRKKEEEVEKDDDGEQLLNVVSAEEPIVLKEEAEKEDDCEQSTTEEHLVWKEEAEEKDDDGELLQLKKVPTEEHIVRKEDAEKEEDDSDKQLKVSINNTAEDQDLVDNEECILLEDSTNDSKTVLYLNYQNIDIHYSVYQRIASPTAYLDDSLVMLRLKLYLDNLSPQMRKKFHVFDSLFYWRYLHEYDEGVQKLTRNIEMFSLDFILIPIVFDSHWSLCVVVRPIEWMLQLYPSAVAHDDNSNEKAHYAHNNKACLLFVDSLLGRIHHFSTDIQKRVKKFLSDEWNYKLDLCFSGSSLITPDPSAAIAGCFTTYSEAELFSFRQRIRSCDQYVLDCVDGKCLFSDIPTVLCNQAPQQSNGYDCGIFCYKFAEVIFNFPTSLQSDLDNGFSDFFNAQTFTQADVTKERECYRLELQKLRETYIAGIISMERRPSSSTTAKVACSPSSSVEYVHTTTKTQRIDVVDYSLNANADLMPPPQRRDKAVLLHCNTIEISSTNLCFIYFEMLYHHYTNNIVSVQSFQSGYISQLKAHLHIGVALQNFPSTLDTFTASSYDLKVISLHVDTYKTELEELFQYDDATRLYEELLKLQRSAPFDFDIVSLESFANEYSDSSKSEISHWWSNHDDTFQNIAMALFTIYFNDPVWYATSMSKENVKLSSTSSFLPQYRFFATEEDLKVRNLEVIFYRQGDVLLDVAKRKIATNDDQSSYTVFKNLNSSKTNAVVISPSVRDSHVEVTPTTNSESEWLSPTQEPRSSQRQTKKPTFFANDEVEQRRSREKKEVKKLTRKKATKTVVDETTSSTKSSRLPYIKTDSKVKKRKKNADEEYHHDNDFLSYHAYEDAGNDYDHQDFIINSSTSTIAPFLLAECGDNQRHPTKRQTRQTNAVKPLFGQLEVKRTSEEIESMLLATVVEAKKEDTKMMLSKTYELQNQVEELKVVAERLRLEKLVAEKEKQDAKLDAEKQRVHAEQEATKIKDEAMRNMAKAEKHRKEAEAEAQLQRQLRITAEKDAAVKDLLAAKDMQYNILKTKFDCTIENRITSKNDTDQAELKGVKLFQKGLDCRNEYLKESFSLVQSVLQHSSSSSSTNYNQHQQSTSTVQQHDPAEEERKKKKEWAKECKIKKRQKRIDKAEKEAAELAASVKQVAELKAAADRKVKELTKAMKDSDSDDSEEDD